MLLTHPFETFAIDARVYLEARALIDHGYRVAILGWDRENKYPLMEQYRGITIYRVRVKSRFGRGFSQIYYLPRFWWQAYQLANRLRVDIVHAHDLDTLPLGYWIARTKGIHLVYDAHDAYPRMLAPFMPGWVTRSVQALERLLIRSPSMIVTASSRLAEEFRKMSQTDVVCLPNWKPSLNGRIPIKLSAALQQRIAGKRVLCFLGEFGEDRCILPLVEFVQKTKDYFLLLGGYGKQQESILRAIQDNPNIHFFGRIGPSEMEACHAVTDLMCILWNPGFPNTIYGSPNRLFNAMASGAAVLTNPPGCAAEICRQEGSGIVIPKADLDSIEKALSSLGDEQLMAMKNNSRRIGREKYEWSFVVHRLMEKYPI